jgi:hypothetical protein
MTKAVAATLTLAAALALVLARGQNLTAEDKKPAPASPFASKVIVLTLNTRDSQGVALRGAQLRQMGGKAFLVGTGLTIQDGGFNNGRTTWVAVDAVAQATEFESVEEMRRAYESGRQAK